MNILFISPIFSGGIGGHASMLADQLSNYGYEVKKMQAPHIPIKNLHYLAQSKELSAERNLT